MFSQIHKTNMYLLKVIRNRCESQHAILILQMNGMELNDMRILLRIDISDEQMIVQSAF